MHFLLAPGSMTLDDLELLISSNFLVILRFFEFLEATTAKRMKIDPHCQRRYCCVHIAGDLGKWGMSNDTVGD